MSAGREHFVQGLKPKLAQLEMTDERDEGDIVALKRAIKHLNRISDKRFLSLYKAAREDAEFALKALQDLG